MAELVDYQLDHRKEVLEFFADVPFKDLIWEWEFEQCPGAADTGFAPIVMSDGQGVVGFNGVIPVSIKYGHQVVEGLWSCDFHVAAKARGMGIGKTIKKHLLGRAPVILSFGVSHQAAVVLEKMGWKRSPEVRSYRLIVKGFSFRERCVRILQTITKLFVSVPSDFCGELIWTSELPCREELDTLWDHSAATYNKVVCRNYDYLDWRYQSHPLADYEFLVARGNAGGLNAVLVLREHNSVVRLVDYVGPSGRPGMLKNMLGEARNRYRDAKLWLATTSDPTLKRVFMSEGFFPGRTIPGLYVYACTGLARSDEASERGWFVMSGDSDGELLRAAWDNWGSE